MRGTRWFVTQGSRPFRMRDTVSRFRPGIETVMGSLDAVIGPRHAAEIDAARAEYEGAGVSPEVARLIAGLPQLLAACDIVRTAPAAGGQSAQLDAARAYFALDGALDLPWLKACIRATPRRGRWDRLALTGLEEDLSWILCGLTQAAIAGGAVGKDPADAQERIEAWLAGKLQGLNRYRALLAELREVPEPDLAMLTVAVRTLAELVPRASDT